MCECTIVNIIPYYSVCLILLERFFRISELADLYAIRTRIIVLS